MLILLSSCLVLYHISCLCCFPVTVTICPTLLSFTCSSLTPPLPFVCKSACSFLKLVSFHWFCFVTLFSGLWIWPCFTESVCGARTHVLVSNCHCSSLFQGLHPGATLLQVPCTLVTIVISWKGLKMFSTFMAALESSSTIMSGGVGAAEMCC